MKIKQKIIAGTLSIVTVLSFGAQLPVSAMENRPGVFQKQFFPDEHNIANKLWARAERTNTAEDWEAAAEACDKAHDAYKKAGNMETATEFLANDYKARGKSNQKNAEEISYNLSRFSVEEIEKKKNQAIDNWNKAAAFYEEAARLFKSTEARGDEDKICEELAEKCYEEAENLAKDDAEEICGKLTDKAYAKIDYKAALSAWEIAKEENTLESWNNAGQLFDQAAQSCRDAGLTEESSLCGKKSKEALEKAISMNKSSINIDTILLEQIECIIEKAKEEAEKQPTIEKTKEEAEKQPIIESWNEAAKLWRKAGKTFEKIHIESEINRCIVGSKQEYAYAALRKAMEAPTIENWDKADEAFGEFAEEYKKTGNKDESNKYIEISDLLRSYTVIKKAEKVNMIESWSRVAEFCEELAEDFKEIGREYEAKGFLVISKQAHINAALKEEKEQPIIEKWNKVGKLYEEIAEGYKEAGDENQANICILKSKQAYSNVAVTRKDWDKVNEINEEIANSCKELAENYKEAGNKDESNKYLAKSKRIYAKLALKEAEIDNTIENWDKVARLYKEAAEAFKNARIESEANKCIAISKKAYANIALKRVEEANAIKEWKEAAELWEKVAEAFKNAGEADKANKFLAESKQAHAYAILKK